MLTKVIEQAETLFLKKNEKEAIRLLQKVADNPQIQADEIYEIGSTLLIWGQPLTALNYFETAIKKTPNLFEAWHDAGLAYTQLRKFKDALSYFLRAEQINPNSPELLYNIARVYDEYENDLKANKYYIKALDRNPYFIEALINIAENYNRSKKIELAISYIQRAIKIDSKYPYLLGTQLHLNMIACNWNQLEELHKAIQAQLSQGKNTIEPFAFQAISTSELDLKNCASIYSRDKYPELPRIQKKNEEKNKKIKLGYVSGEFYEQATSILIVGLLESHNKMLFEIYGFDNGKDDSSPIRKRISYAFDHMVDIKNLSDQAAADLISKLDIDILINLNGFFGKGRQGIFALRPSPIQINYLGFPGTIGVEYMNFIIADPIVLPENSKQYYSEKIAYLPNSYQPNDRQRVASNIKISRSSVGLKETDFVYCCFNNNYKITPPIFTIWMELLLQTPQSVLWLLEDNELAAKNLRLEAKKRGVSEKRIIFAKRVSSDEHLARHCLADLFIDTLPYNAHTTASDALWMGLPVLTCLGTTFPGRVAASLLNALEMNELITTSLKDYRGLALELAQDKKKLESIKQKLNLNRATKPLFKTQLYTRHIEAAYLEMHKQLLSGMPFEDIRISQ